MYGNILTVDTEFIYTKELKQKPKTGRRKQNLVQNRVTISKNCIQKPRKRLKKIK